MRPPLVWQQPHQTLALEAGLRLVEGRSADSETCGDIGDGQSLGVYAAQHLVAGLDQVTRIEELARGKRGIVDVVRMRIHRATLLEGCELGVGFSGTRHM